MKLFPDATYMISFHTYGSISVGCERFDSMFNEFSSTMLLYFLSVHLNMMYSNEAGLKFISDWKTYPLSM